MTREEEISFLVRVVRRIRNDRHAKIAQISELAPDPYWSQEQRAALRSLTELGYEFELAPVWRRLLERIASEDRGGIIYLNPVTDEHAILAQNLIEGTP